MFANAGGLGAGAVIIPIYIFIYGFAPTDSIPLSKITIFAGAIANVLFMWNERKEGLRNNFLISYEMAAAMIPLLLCGTMIGVLLSKFLPPAVVTGCLVLYLVYSTWKMFEKARQITKKENTERAKLTAIQQQNNSEMNTVIQDNQDSQVALPDTEGRQQAKDLELQMECGDDQEEVPLTTGQMLKKQLCNFFLLLSSYFFVLIIALLRGGEGKGSVIGINPCSEASWLLLLSGQLLGFAVSLMAYHQNKHIYKAEDQGIAEKKKLRKKILIMSYFTGIAAGTLGIGGGMILGPFMLALGMEPTIATALSGFTVLFTSSSTTSQFIIAGAIHLQHAWVLMIFSLIGSFIGNLILKRLIKKYKRPSLVIWVIFGILMLSCCVLPAQTIYNAIVKQGAFAFGGVC